VSTAQDEPTSDDSGAAADGLDAANNGGAEAADAVFAIVPPGLVFFLGGLTVLLLGALYWYRRRPAY
jgi:hypothetical protein